MRGTLSALHVSCIINFITSSLSVVSSRTDWIDWTDWLERQVEEVGERGNVLPMLVVSLSSFKASESEKVCARGLCFGFLGGGE